MLVLKLKLHPLVSSCSSSQESTRVALSLFQFRTNSCMFFQWSGQEFSTKSIHPHLLRATERHWPVLYLLLLVTKIGSHSDIKSSQSLRQWTDPSRWYWVIRDYRTFVGYIHTVNIAALHHCKVAVQSMGVKGVFGRPLMEISMNNGCVLLVFYSHHSCVKGPVRFSFSFSFIFYFLSWQWSNTKSRGSNTKKASTHCATRPYRSGSDN